MSKPEISVCCTVFNNRNRIRASLDSIIAAPGFKEKMEIVISENFSTDGTWDVLQEYAKKHKNIIAFRAKCGLGLGRALAFEKSKWKVRHHRRPGHDIPPCPLGSLWRRAKACKENEMWIHAAFTMRKTISA